MDLTKIRLTRKDVARAIDAANGATRMSIADDTSVAMVEAVLGPYDLIDQKVSSTLLMAIKVEVARAS